VNLICEKAKVKRYFENFELMGKEKGTDLSRAVKKRYDQLKASINFGIYLKVGLGRPHPLYGNLKGCYGISVTGNIRLIVRPKVDSLDPDSLIQSDTVIIEGVMDYHGKKNEWIIP